MKKLLMWLLLLSLCTQAMAYTPISNRPKYFGADATYSQQQIEEVLLQIEQNNADLKAARQFQELQAIEARVGNSLVNPSVEYLHSWGRPSALGKSWEVSVTQEFDLPNVYVSRNKLAKIRAEQYGYEYQMTRQSILTEAKLLCIEIAALNWQMIFVEQAMIDADHVSEKISERVESGDVNVLDKHTAEYEMMGKKKAYKSMFIDIANAQSRLTALNGGVSITYDGGLANEKITLRPLDEMVSTYEQKAPEYMAILARQKAVAREVKVSRGQSMPKITLGYKYEKTTGEKFNGVIVGLSIPMFGNRHNVKRAKAEVRLADAQLVSAKVDLRATLEQLYEQEYMLRELIREYEKIVDGWGPVESFIKALAEGHITLIEYYVQVCPFYETSIDMVEAIKEHQQVCVQINMIDL